MKKFLVIKPWRPYIICQTLDKAKEVCDEFNEKLDYKSYVLELDEDGYTFWITQHNYDLDKSKVVYDPFEVCPTQEKKKFYDNTIFTRAFKARKQT